MKSPHRPVGLPLDYANEIAIEMHLMRGECSDFARAILEQSPEDLESLEECALLDEALARAHTVLIDALRCIRASRVRRQHGEG